MNHVHLLTRLIPKKSLSRCYSTAHAEAESQMRKALGLPPQSQPLLRRGDVSRSPLLLDDLSAFPYFSEHSPPSHSPPSHSPSSSSTSSSRALPGIVVDTRSFHRPAQLSLLHRWIQPALPSLAPSARILFITRSSPSAAPFHAAVVGFSRSLAKELGRTGVTCNVVSTAAHQQDALSADPSLRNAAQFLLSPSAAFISGQTLHLSDAAAMHLHSNHQPSHSNQSSNYQASHINHSHQSGLAIVTGAARGIGHRTAMQLATSLSSGFHSVLAADMGAFPQESVLRQRDNVECLQLDVTDDAGFCRAVAQRAERSRQRVRALVLNAGITRDALLRRMTAQEFDAVLQVNLEAVVRTVERLRSGDLLDGGARIVLLSSINGISGAAGQTNYAMTKSALIGYARALAPALAAEGATVNCVAPGFIETDMTKAMPADRYLFASLTNALGQAGLPEDIANAIEFLTLPSSFAITGQTLRVCGLHMTGK